MGAGNLLAIMKHLFIVIGGVDRVENLTLLRPERNLGCGG